MSVDTVLRTDAIQSLKKIKKPFSAEGLQKNVIFQNNCQFKIFWIIINTEVTRCFISVQTVSKTNYIGKVIMKINKIVLLKFTTKDVVFQNNEQFKYFILIRFTIKTEVTSCVISLDT